MIKVKGLSAGYGNRAVIKDIHCGFSKGEISVIIGPNGSGKSTLLKAITGTCAVQGGEILLEEKPIGLWKQMDVAKKMSYLPQNRSLPSISVKKMVLHGRFPYLGYPRVYRDLDYKKADEAMEALGILHLAEKKVGRLSGGERQKVYLAMALAGETEIIVLDEPTAYLDIGFQLEFLEILKRLKKEKKTIIMVLHDLSYALHMADQILLLYKGEQISFAAPEEILKQGSINQVFGIQTEVLWDSLKNRQYIFRL